MPKQNKKKSSKKNSKRTANEEIKQELHLQPIEYDELDDVVREIIQWNSEKQDSLTVPKNKGLRDAFLNLTLDLSKDITDSKMNELRDSASAMQNIYTINKAEKTYTKESCGKASGNDEFFKTEHAIDYYTQDSVTKPEYGYRNAFIDFRQGVNTFVHKGGKVETGKYKDFHAISGHSGNLRRFKDASSTKGEITVGSDKYHSDRDEVIYDTTNGKLKEQPLEQAIGSLMKKHLNGTMNHKTILENIALDPKNYVISKNKTEYSKNLTDNKKVAILSSNGLTIPHDREAFARTMELNRTKIKIVYAKLKHPDEKLDVNKDGKLSRDTSVSPVRCNTPISRLYTADILRRANEAGRNLSQLGKLTRERAPVIKTR